MRRGEAGRGGTRRFPPVDFANEPTEGFVLNKGVGGVPGVCPLQDRDEGRESTEIQGVIHPMHPDLIHFTLFLTLNLLAVGILSAWGTWSWLRSRIAGREQRLRLALARIQQIVQQTAIPRDGMPMVKTATLLANIQYEIDGVMM